MKLHITQKAIDAVALQFKIATRSVATSGTVDLLEYFRGKRYAIVETFAELTGIDWKDAFDMLHKRSENL